MYVHVHTRVCVFVLVCVRACVPVCCSLSSMYEAGLIRFSSTNRKPVTSVTWLNLGYDMLQLIQLAGDPWFVFEILAVMAVLAVLAVLAILDVLAG